MAGISINQVTKSYGGYTALQEIDLTIGDGEFLVLVGPSGCGKSTLLRMVAGLETISGGEIRIGERRVNDLLPKDRDIAMIFQSYALFPHMTVERNLGFGLKLRGTPKAEADSRIQAAARTLGLQPFLGRYPAQLSGGQRQRVAIGRALVRNPSAFLMDEPLANLDTKLRVHMRTEFGRLREQLRTTTIYVTHDQTEAMTLGHRVCVMRNGSVQQVDTPDAIYARPANIFVAGFIGSPEMNFGLGRVSEDHVEMGTIRLPLDLAAVGSKASDLDGREVVVGIRPNDLVPAEAGDGVIDAKIEIVERLGSENLIVFPIPTRGIRADEFGQTGAKAAEDHIANRSPNETAFTAKLDGKLKPLPGERIALAVKPGGVYLFDAKTGGLI